MTASATELGTRLDRLCLVTACWNSEKTIEETFQSVARQWSPDSGLQYVVIDGASTDGTMEIVRKWQDAGLVTHVVTERDKGIYDAMNKGWRLADAGRYVAFLNSDDSLENGALAACAKAVEGGPVYFFGDAWREDARGNRSLERGDNRELPRSAICNHQALWVRKDAMEELEGFSLNSGLAADLDFIWRLVARYGDGTHVPEVLCIFREGGASSSPGNDHSIVKVYLRHVGVLRGMISPDTELRRKFLIGWCQRVKRWAQNLSVDEGDRDRGSARYASDLLALIRGVDEVFAKTVIGRFGISLISVSLSHPGSSALRAATVFLAKAVSRWESWQIAAKR